VTKELGKAANLAIKALQSPGCAKLFGVTDPASLFGSLVQDDLTIGPIVSPPGTTVSATTEGTTLVTPNGTFPGAEIKINDVAGTFVTGTLNDQIVTLLHEFGHAVNFIDGAGTSQIVDDGPSVPGGVQKSMDNTALVKQDCLPVK
jgi:hypothetical protein